MMDSMPTPVYDIVRSNFLLYIEDDVSVSTPVYDIVRSKFLQ